MTYRDASRTQHRGFAYVEFESPESEGLAR